jgi:hypothetical protein
MKSRCVMAWPQNTRSVVLARHCCLLLAVLSAAVASAQHCTSCVDGQPTSGQYIAMHARNTRGVEDRLQHSVTIGED